MSLLGGLIGHLRAKNVVNADLAKKGFMIVPSLSLNGSFLVQCLLMGLFTKVNLEFYHGSNFYDSLTRQIEKISCCLGVSGHYCKELFSP